MGENQDTAEPAPGVLGDPRRRRSRRARFFGAAGLSLAAHLAILVAVLSIGRSAPSALPPPPVTVALVAAPSPQPPSPPPAPAKPEPPKPPPPRSLFRPTIARAPDPEPAHEIQASDPLPSLTDAELAGAATAGAGSGAGGGGAPCDMARRVQDALRRDPLVQAAIAPLSGKALMIWDGDWVWLPGEDGRGLTAVRQAVMWEIAFAPSDCRSQTMHGLVVISPTEANRATRLALGHGDWRWSDLLVPHPGSGGAPAEP